MDYFLYILLLVHYPGLDSRQRYQYLPLWILVLRSKRMIGSVPGTVSGKPLPRASIEIAPAVSPASIPPTIGRVSSNQSA